MTLKKITILIILLIPSYLINAQGIFVQPNIGYGLTSIYNKEDTKKVDYTNAKLERTLQPRFGIQFGYQFAIEQMGLSRVSLGAAYLPIHQNYGGTITSASNEFDIEALRQLNYIQIPLLLEFNFIPTASLQPTFTIGVSYNNLLSNSSSYLSSPNGELQEIDGQMEKYLVYDAAGQPTRERTITASDGLYKKSAIMGHLGFGISYPIGKLVELNLAAQSALSFGDIENKKEMTFSYDYGTSQPSREFTYNPYAEFVDFTRQRDGITSEKRENTSIRTLGIQFGLTFKLFNPTEKTDF